MARGLFKFWLDSRKDDELLLSEAIDELKQKRVFTRAIREGIAIVYDLMNGRVDALLHYYPWVADVLSPDKPTSETDELKQQLQELKQLVIEQGGQNIPGSPTHMIPPAYKPGRALPPKPINDTPMVAANDDSSQTFLDAFM